MHICDRWLKADYALINDEDGAPNIKAGKAQFIIVDGVEFMSRTPFVMPKAQTACSCASKMNTRVRTPL
jgi:acetyl-CoA acetyltransferase